MDNETRFAQNWMLTNEALMNAIANPTRAAFEAAHAQGIRTLGSAYTGVSPDSGVEWEMGQALTRMIRDVAKESGCPIR
jgi:hypothetical protein